MLTFDGIFAPECGGISEAPAEYAYRASFAWDDESPRGYWEVRAVALLNCRLGDTAQPIFISRAQLVAAFGEECVKRHEALTEAQIAQAYAWGDLGQKDAAE